MKTCVRGLILTLALAAPFGGSASERSGSDRREFDRVRELKGQESSARCELLMKTLTELEKQKQASIRLPDFDNDLEYLRELKEQAALGDVIREYDPRFKTWIYRSVRSHPGRALYVFFHGSGTAKAGGINFVHRMNELINLGYSVLSFDMPFHAEGPMSERFNNADYFMNWVRGIIQANRVVGKPVYLVGHSFGPDVAAEYLARFPTDVDGGVLISPAVFNEVLRDWYNHFTSRMKFGGDASVPNDAGGEWAEAISKKFQWNKTLSSETTDPSRVNPSLKIRVVTGDREEYVPAPVGGPNRLPVGPNTYDVCEAIKEYLKNIECVKVAGVGHYIFLHREHGINVIGRELLAVDGRTPRDEAELAKEKKTWNSDEFSAFQNLFETSRLFQSWVQQTFGLSTVVEVIKSGNKSEAKRIYGIYLAAVDQRRQQIQEHIQKLRETDSKFFEANKAEIENEASKRDSYGFFMKYLDYLETHQR